MPKVGWVVSYGFCSKFRTLSSRAKILKTGEDLTELQTVKGGNVFETRCTMTRDQDI